jgi:hypothetical protein
MSPLAHALQPLPATSQLHHSVTANFTNSVYGWTECTDNSTERSAFEYNYRSTLWSASLEWMRMPPSTHLLIFGRSSIAQVSSAVRSGNRALGTLLRSEIITHADFCRDPEAPVKMVTECLYQCPRWLNCGPNGADCTDDPHSITVDYFVGGSTITTISNHPESQRVGSRLDEWLALVAPERNFTHAAFMDPHPDFYFDRACVSQWRHNHTHVKGDYVNKKPVPDPRPPRRGRFKRANYCHPESEADCVERHPHYDTIRSWVTGTVASVIEPPRNEENEIPGSIQKLDDAIDTTLYDFSLKCVTDDQLTNMTECPKGMRNTTVWLAQAQEAYERFSENAVDEPAQCVCKHICNARCVQKPGSTDPPHCYMGPGVAAAWLILRAAGLAMPVAFTQDLDAPLDAPDPEPLSEFIDPAPSKKHHTKPSPSPTSS